MKKRVGIIGFGTIGKYIFEKLSEDGVEFAFIFHRQAMPNEGSLFINSSEELLQRCAEGVDLVIEAATAHAVTELAPAILQLTSLVVFSATALAEKEFLERIQEICQTSNHKLYIPHGAILGLDGILDGKDVLQEVTITTTKKPENFGCANNSRMILYEGATRNACRLYPRNVNVHAGLALAGLGFDETLSRIVSDPNSPGNIHRIEVKAQGCRFTIEVASEPIAGVTGAYTPVSAYSSIRRILCGSQLVIV